jgi:hypothetical protein
LRCKRLQLLEDCLSELWKLVRGIAMGCSRCYFRQHVSKEDRLRYNSRSVTNIHWLLLLLSSESIAHVNLCAAAERLDKTESCGLKFENVFDGLQKLHLIQSSMELGDVADGLAEKQHQIRILLHNLCQFLKNQHEKEVSARMKHLDRRDAVERSAECPLSFVRVRRHN